MWVRGRQWNCNETAKCTLRQTEALRWSCSQKQNDNNSCNSTTKMWREEAREREIEGAKRHRAKATTKKKRSIKWRTVKKSLGRLKPETAMKRRQQRRRQQRRRLQRLNAAICVVNRADYERARERERVEQRAHWGTRVKVASAAKAKAECKNRNIKY